MDNEAPSPSEWLLFAAFAIIWIGLSDFLNKTGAGVDVYLFRDAAVNYLDGLGYKTASFEHSHSFVPVFYSSYTPGTLWIFLAFAKFFGTGLLTAQLYPRIWAVACTVLALFAGLKFLTGKTERRLFIIVLGVILPFGLLNPSPDRPEGVSLVVLALLLRVMRRVPTFGSAGLAGIIAGLAFLCQPFAGVIAVLLIAGWLIFTAMIRPVADSRGAAHRAGTFAGLVCLSAASFSMPVGVTAIAFYHIDNQSLDRFWQQATVAGISRQASYSSGDADQSSIGNSVSSTEQTVKLPLFEKYRDALSSQTALGPIHLASMAVTLAIVFGWLVMVLMSAGHWRSRCALFSAGAILFLLPIIVFPLQYNYLLLTRALFPLLLASNWAYTRLTLRNKYVVPLLIIANVIAVIPASAIEMVVAAQSRSSYVLARKQADTLRGYLLDHPLNDKVVLVPATHYFIYKDPIQRIYNPAYLSSMESPDDVGAIVNCYASTRNFSPGTLVLPQFVQHRKWRQLDVARDSLSVSVLGHRIMSRNWSMSCDLYVPQS